MALLSSPSQSNTLTAMLRGTPLILNDGTYMISSYRDTEFELLASQISFQFDKHTVPDMVDVYGSVSCKAELEGHLPEVTMTIAPEDSPGSSLLDHVITHSCVQSLEPQKPMNMSAGECHTLLTSLFS